MNNSKCIHFIWKLNSQPINWHCIAKYLLNAQVEKTIQYQNFKGFLSRFVSCLKNSNCLITREPLWNQIALHFIYVHQWLKSNLQGRTSNMCIISLWYIDFTVLVIYWYTFDIFFILFLWYIDVTILMICHEHPTQSHSSKCRKLLYLFRFLYDEWIYNFRDMW